MYVTPRKQWKTSAIPGKPSWQSVLDKSTDNDLSHPSNSSHYIIHIYVYTYTWLYKDSMASPWNITKQAFQRMFT